ncbi:MAG: helix-turn-helix transcriptional regulator [Acutalibacteraceae bacterium]
MRLAELLKESGISRTKLCQRAEMQPAQLNNYCYNTITRLDTDVLARLCTGPGLRNRGPAGICSPGGRRSPITTPDPTPVTL